jgi:hypothetical protein
MFNREKMIKHQDWGDPVFRQTHITALFWSNLGKHKAPSSCFLDFDVFQLSLSIAAVRKLGECCLQELGWSGWRHFGIPHKVGAHKMLASEAGAP